MAPRRAGGLLLIALAIVAAVSLYLHIARIQSGVNSNLGMSDQSAYMDFAADAYNTQWQYTGGRNRMPLLPWLMALFYTPDMSEEAFFAVGKLVNTWLSAQAIALLGAAFLRRFEFVFAVYAILCIAFLAFVLKAPFFQAEILFYSLFAAAYIRALDHLRQPAWRIALEVGLLLALAHFTKASVLPALVIFAASLALLWCIRLLRGDIVRGGVLRLPAQIALCLIAFVAALLPYLHESYLRYGSHFYNVNTTFYVWYDSWAEAKAGTKAAGDREGYPVMPPELIPSMGKYLSEHTAQEVIDRFVNGARRLIDYGCLRADSAHRYGYCPQVAAGLAILALALPWLMWLTKLRVLAENAPVIFLSVTTFAVYALGAAWYMPITGNQGPRVLLVLIVPFFWTLGSVVHAPAIHALKLRVGAFEVRAVNLIFGLLSLSVVYEIYQLATWRAATLYGGK